MCTQKTMDFFLNIKIRILGTGPGNYRSGTSRLGKALPALFFLLIGFSTVLCLLLGDPNNHALLGSLASLTNVGPSLGSIGSMGNYNAEPSALKFVFSADMFLGRVEIYPVLAVLSSIINPKSK